MSQNPNVYDVLGIGFGPANLALAIAMEETDFPYSVRFLEKTSENAAIWQKEMLLGKSDIQNHPLRDLVTPRNPRSRYSFVNYLFENNRLYEHLNLGMNFPYRVEYANYISWVACHFKHLVNYDSFVKSITLKRDNYGKPAVFCVNDLTGNTLYGRSVVIAPGRTPYIPKVFQSLAGKNICHISNFLSSLELLKGKRRPLRICVVGGSQSAVEIILHLSDHYPDAHVTGILRNFGYRQKDCSPFTGEVYFPQFVDLYYNSSLANRKRLTKDLYYTNYSAADVDVLDDLYRKMYLQRMAGQEKINIHRLAEIREARQLGNRVGILFTKLESSEECFEKFDLVVMATGFRNMGADEHEELYPTILEGLRPDLMHMHQEGLAVGQDYRLGLQDEGPSGLACYINGLCESTHGMGDAGSFSLLALRSQVITDSLKKVLSGNRPVVPR